MGRTLDQEISLAVANGPEPTRIWTQFRQSWAGGHRAHGHQDPNVSQATATLTWQEETRTLGRGG